MAGETVKKPATLKLTNATQGDIILTLGPVKMAGDGHGHVTHPRTVHIKAMNIGNPAIVEGEDAEVLLRDDYFKGLTDSGAIIVNRDPKLGEGMRAASEPVPPADLIQKTTPGTEVANVGGIGVKVDEFKVGQ